MSDIPRWILKVYDRELFVYAESARAAQQTFEQYGIHALPAQIQLDEVSRDGIVAVVDERKAPGA